MTMTYRQMIDALHETGKYQVLKYCAYKGHNRDNPLPIDEFGVHNGQLDGLNAGYQSYCRECDRAIQAKRTAEKTMLKELDIDHLSDEALRDVYRYLRDKFNDEETPPELF